MRQWAETEGARDSRQYPLLNRVHARHSELLKVDPENTVLDLGCGRNPISYHLEPVEVVGIDPDVRLLKEAKGLSLSDHLCCSVGDALPFASETFDSVFVQGVVHHLSERQRAATFAEIHRVLKPGGEVLVLEPDPDRLYRRIVWWFADAIGYRHEQSPHVDESGYVSPADIGLLCERADLDVVEQSYTGSVLSPLAFVYPATFGVGILEGLYRALPAKWWSVTRAMSS